MTESGRQGGGADLGAVRGRLRDELIARGFAVASDTLGRGGLYIVGENDLALALFEVKPDVREACESMYQGSWVAGLPPRFAVLPAREARNVEVELLEQMRVVPVFFEQHAEATTFIGLDEALAEHVG